MAVHNVHPRSISGGVKRDIAYAGDERVVASGISNERRTMKFRPRKLPAAAR